MAEFASFGVYIGCASDLRQKIARIDQIITALEIKAIDATLTQDISEMWLDDGQTKVKTMYRGVESISRSILTFQRLRNDYESKLVGRGFRLVDSKNFRSGC